jgi:hypothetical protein
MATQIDPAAVDWDRLMLFASKLTLAQTGRVTLVRPAIVEDGRTLGAAGFSPAAGAHEIELSLDQSRASLTRVYFHEVGHVFHAHVKKPIAAGGATLSTVDQVEPDIRERVRQRLVLIEGEAEQFADMLQAAFQREMGAAWVDWPFRE